MLLKNIVFRFSNLHPYLLSNLKRMKQYPLNRFQKECLQSIQNNNSFFLNSSTGSGKTNSYLIPILNHILTGSRDESQHGAIIVTLTKELCIQIYRQIRLLDIEDRISISRSGSISYFSNIVQNKRDITQREKHQMEVIANENVVNSINWPKLDILVSTPSTLYNILKNNKIKVNPKFFVIDEADLLIELDKNVSKSTIDIINLLNKSKGNEDRQFMITCSTFPSKIQKSESIATLMKWFPKLEIIQGEFKHKIPKTLEVNFVEVQDLLKDSVSKYQVLLGILKEKVQMKIIIFCNSADSCKKLVQQLDADKIDCLYLSAALNMQDRVKVLSDYDTAEHSIIVTTDIMSRGFDLNVGVVIEYQMAKNVVDYINRAGRTARFGKKGQIITFVESDDKNLFVHIKQKLKHGEQFDELFSRNRSFSKKMKPLQQ